MKTGILPAAVLFSFAGLAAMARAQDSASTNTTHFELICDTKAKVSMISPATGRRRSVNRTAAIDVDIYSWGGRIHIPDALLPDWHIGNTTWFKVDNVTISPGEVTGYIFMNFFTKYQFSIDRYHGTIDINNLENGMSGVCMPDADSKPKF